MIAGLVADGPDEEVRLYTEAAGVARELGDSALLAHCVNNIGNVELSRGEYERALELFQESLAVGRELGDQDLMARASTNLGFTTLLLDDVRGARPLLRDGLGAARELGMVEGFVYGFVGLGAAYAREDPARAARLLGRADELCEERAHNLEPLEARVRDETKAALRASLGKDAYAALHAEGRALTLEDALTLALRPD
jgi:tetratricopeptide (TPR) repeat protein